MRLWRLEQPHAVHGVEWNGRYDEQPRFHPGDAPRHTFGGLHRQDQVHRSEPADHDAFGSPYMWFFYKESAIEVADDALWWSQPFQQYGQEALSGYRKEHHAVTTGHYKRYVDEELDKRIANPQIEGSVLLMDIDNVPRIVTLPQSVIEAYHEGALTVNTIANRILAHTDQMTTEQQRSHTSSERYEQSLEREHSRGIR